MITADPGRRRSVLDEVQGILAREAPAEDRDLLLSLAPVVYADLPDAMALGLRPTRSPPGSGSTSGSSSAPCRPRTSSTGASPGSTWSHGA